VLVLGVVFPGFGVPTATHDVIASHVMLTRYAEANFALGRNGAVTTLQNE
jgi:hypothetical protein